MCELLAIIIPSILCTTMLVGVVVNLWMIKRFESDNKKPNRKPNNDFSQ